MPYHLDRRDMDFVLFEHLGLTDLVETEKYSEMSRELFDMVLTEAQKFATDVLAPLNRVADTQGCKLVDGEVVIPDGFKEAYKKYAQAGWVSAHLNPEYGGQGLPLTIHLAATEMFVGACTAFLFYPGLTTSGGHLVENFASQELVDLFVPKLYSGEWTATMCLTEPHAGSAVGDLKSSAKPNDDGTYAIKGTKIFISAGDHDLADNIVHLVLARVDGDPDGIKGISLFAVPKYFVEKDGSVSEEINDVVCSGLEHKMGIHGCSTCVMNFGDEGECRGYLIGEQRQGIVAMFQMMNEARIVCGAQGMALGNAAYQAALAYARERVQGTSIKNFKDPDAERVTIIDHPDVRRMLLMQKAYSEGLRALVFKASILADKEVAETDPKKKEALSDQLGLLTPIVKAYGSDKGFKVTELAIQTHGGYGYIGEYEVEQYMRDCKIASIYEGTNGIQAMDLLGRKVPMKGGAVLMNLIQEVNLFVEKNREREDLTGSIELLEKTKNAIGEVAFHFSSMGRKEPEVPMLNAVPFLEMMGDLVVAHLLLEQAVIAEDKLADGVAASSTEGRFYDGKIKTAKFFAANVLPHAIATAKSIRLDDRSALEITF